VFPKKRESKPVVCFPPCNLRAPSLSMLTSAESDHQKTPWKHESVKRHQWKTSLLMGAPKTKWSVWSYSTRDKPKETCTSASRLIRRRAVCEWPTPPSCAIILQWYKHPTDGVKE
jgi:hypothetical protein